MKTLARVAATVVGFGLAAAAIVVMAFYVLWTTFTATVHPDPDVSDGDPCCGHPDTWGEILVGGGAVVGLCIAAGAVVALGLALAQWGVVEERPNLRRLALLPLTTAALAATAFGVGLLFALDDPPPSANDVASRATP